MIELPTTIKPNSIEPKLLDYGFVQRGAASLRVDRAGNRWAITFNWPIIPRELIDEYTSDLSRAKRKGLKQPIPLLNNQGLPGSPVVDGAATGSSETFAVRGFTANYAARKGFWLTIVEAATGKAFLHRMASTVTADALGDATLDVEPPLRAPFADGDTIEFSAPWIEGFIDGDEYGWRTRPDTFTEPAVTVEEFE